MKWAGGRLPLSVRYLAPFPWRRKFHARSPRRKEGCLEEPVLIRYIRHDRPKTDDEGNADSTSSLPMRLRTGTRISRTGQFDITDIRLAARRMDHALIVSNASTQLRREDFLTVLPKDVASSEIRESLLNVVIGRDASHNRLSFYILLFSSSHYASHYQSRLLWLHRNASQNLPIHPLHPLLSNDGNRRVTPPEGWKDEATGEDVWEAIRSFSILAPDSSFSVQAMMPPFSEDVVRELEQWSDWNTIKRNGTIEPCWPVHVHLREQDQEMGPKDIQVLLEIHDGHDLQKKVHGFAVMKNLTSKSSGDYESSGWIIRFINEKDAMNFWRRWHLRVHPRSADNSRMLHVDPLW